MEGARKLRLRVVGSWTRVLIAAAILVFVWLVFVWLAASGHLAGLRSLNVPLLHPYPPAGYVQNPFNAGDKGDLISSSEANRVKTDLRADGQLELRALEIGDLGLVSQADTGRAAANLSALIVQNNAAGLFEREQMKLDSVVVGRLPDPNDSTIAWMVEERGTATISYYSKSNNSLVRQLSMKAIARFWLLKVGGRYLVADVQIISQAAPGASP